MDNVENIFSDAYIELRRKYPDAINRYMSKMEKDHGMKSMWSLEKDSWLRDPVRVMSHIILEEDRKTHKSATPIMEDHITNVSHKINNYVSEMSDLEKQIAELQNQHFQLSVNFREFVGVIDDTPEFRIRDRYMKG